MKQIELIQFLKAGESEVVEFKEGVKSIAKTICAFANSQGGYILIGITNQGEIIGIKAKEAVLKQKISNELQSIYPAPKISISSAKIDQKTIFVIKIEKADSLLSASNIVYIRLGVNNRPLSTQEVIEKAAESLQVLADELPCKNAKQQDIIPAKIKDYLQKRKIIRGVEMQGNVADNLFKLKIVIKEKQKIIPTCAGILFFAQNPQNFLPFSTIRLVHFKDSEMREYLDAQTFSGTLPEIVEQVYQYLAKNIKTLGGWMVGFKRMDFREYPLEALREAIINAIIHRNYLASSEIKIFIFPDRIEIKNPGSFPPGVTPEHPEHKPRNPILAQYMYDLGYIEKYGAGIAKIKKLCREHPLVNVYYHIKPFFTNVTFKKDKKIKLDKIEEDILNIIKREGSASSGKLAREIKLSRQTVVERLRNLANSGLIRKQGKGRGVKYLLV